MNNSNRLKLRGQIEYVLKRVAFVGAFLSLAGAGYFKYKIQRRFMKEAYYRQPLHLMSQYGPAKEKLGEPMFGKGLDLGQTTVNGLNASLVIPVRGIKTWGTLYAESSRENNEAGWEVDKLQLQIEKGKKWTFYQRES